MATEIVLFAGQLEIKKVTQSVTVTSMHQDAQETIF